MEWWLFKIIVSLCIVLYCCLMSKINFTLTTLSKFWWLPLCIHFSTEASMYHGGDSEESLLYQVEEGCAAKVCSKVFYLAILFVVTLWTPIHVTVEGHLQNILFKNYVVMLTCDPLQTT